MTCGYRACQSRVCGSIVRPDGIELVYCVAHEAIARNLPLLRPAACCASEGCGRPRGQRSPLCKSCRPRYSAWGLDGYPAPQEAPMTEPTPPSKLPELGFPRVQIQASSASLADLEAAATGATTPTPLAAPQDAADGGATPLPEAVEAFLLTAKPAPADDGEPSEGDIQDAYSGRWGQYVEVARLPMSTPTLPPEPTDLAALAARGQQPTAPGPTVAELQQQLAAERARADLLDAEAVSQRQRAEAVEAELFEVDRTLQHLGAYGNGPTIDRLLKVLTPEDRRNILELQAAEARMDLARLRARRLNHAPPEKLAEYAAKVAALDARIAALDAEKVQQ